MAKQAATAGLGLPQTPEAQSGGSRSNSAVLGDIIFLMLHSGIHRGWPLALLERNVLPAIHHKQFRLYHDSNGRPIGYASWAWLSDELEKLYAAGTYGLKPDDWKSGANAWMIDFVAPFGHAMAVRRHLRQEKVFSPSGVCKAFRKVRGEDAMWVMQFGRRRDGKVSEWRNYKRAIVKAGSQI